MYWWPLEHPQCMRHFADLKGATSAWDPYFCLLHSIILPTHDTCKWIYPIKYFLWSPPNSYKINFFEPRAQLTVSRRKTPKTLCFNTQNDKKITCVSDFSTDPTRESLTRGNGCQRAVSLARQRIVSCVKGRESPYKAICSDWHARQNVGPVCHTSPSQRLPRVLNSRVGTFCGSKTRVIFFVFFYTKTRRFASVGKQMVRCTVEKKEKSALDRCNLGKRLNGYFCKISTVAHT